MSNHPLIFIPIFVFLQRISQAIVRSNYVAILSTRKVRIDNNWYPFPIHRKRKWTHFVSDGIWTLLTDFNFCAIDRQANGPPPSFVYTLFFFFFFFFFFFLNIEALIALIFLYLSPFQCFIFARIYLSLCKCLIWKMSVLDI